MIAVFNASKYPNVAASKLASIHGCELYPDFDLFTPPLSKAYISAIFSWEKPKADRIAEEVYARGARTVSGGPGISTETWREIEDYPLEGFSHSYTSVGCIRDCPWCITPRQYLDGIRELDEWGYAPSMLDANILATSDEHKARVIETLAGRMVKWECGLDTRLIDKSNAQFIANTSGPIMFLAWDTGDDEEPLVKALENLRAVGINPRNQVKVYILTGYEGGWESGWYRAERVKQLGATPFIMLYQNLYSDKKEYPQIYKDLARWCNKAQALWSCSFDEYQRGR